MVMWEDHIKGTFYIQKAAKWRPSYPKYIDFITPLPQYSIGKRAAEATPIE